MTPRGCHVYLIAIGSIIVPGWASLLMSSFRVTQRVYSPTVLPRAIVKEKKKSGKKRKKYSSVYEKQFWHCARAQQISTSDILAWSFVLPSQRKFWRREPFHFTSVYFKELLRRTSSLEHGSTFLSAVSVQCNQCLGLTEVQRSIKTSHEVS